MTTSEKAFQQIKKLLKLAKSDNANEAELAAARAQELMLYHQIDAADIDLTEGEAPRPKEEIGRETLDSGKQRRTIWKGRLASAVAKGFGCRMYWQGKHTIIVGRPSDVQTVKYLYDFLVRELERLAADDFMMYKLEGGNVHGKTWKTNFYDGAVEAIDVRLYEQRQEIFNKVRDEAEAVEADETATTGAKCTALARVRELDRLEEETRELNEYYKNIFGPRGGRSITVNRTYNHNARSAGRAAGNNVRLSGGRPLAKGKDRLGS